MMTHCEELRVKVTQPPHSTLWLLQVLMAFFWCLYSLLVFRGQGAPGNATGTHSTSTHAQRAMERTSSYPSNPKPPLPQTTNTSPRPHHFLRHASLDRGQAAHERRGTVGGQGMQHDALSEQSRGGYERGGGPGSQEMLQPPQAELQQQLPQAEEENVRLGRNEASCVPASQNSLTGNSDRVGSGLNRTRRRSSVQSMRASKSMGDFVGQLFLPYQQGS